MNNQPPKWIWSPQDHWSIYKGIGRIIIFIGMIIYGLGLLGMRAAFEDERKRWRAEVNNE